MAIPLGPGDPPLSYALAGVMRGGVGRAGAVDGRVYMSIDGQQVAWASDDQDVGTLLRSLTISDILDETPNTCRFRVNGYVPPLHAEIIITLGSKNRLQRLFAGYALTVQQLYAGVPRNVQADVTAVDYTWLLGFTKVTAAYRNRTATEIIRDLVSRFSSNGFTTGAVAAGLPLIDEITFTNEDLPTAITRTCRRVGAYWYCDYAKRVHAFVTETTNGTPADIVPTHASLAHFRKAGEGTQAITRVFSEGRGSRLLADVNAADDRIPVESVGMFAPPSPDVFLKCSFQGAEGGAQHLDYTTVIDGGAGSLVGPGNAPGAGPTLALLAGGAVDLGTHDYAYTWITAAGETKPSAAATVQVSGTVEAGTLQLNLLQQPNPPVDPNVSGAWRPGDTVDWTYSYSTRPAADIYVAGTSTPLAPARSAIAELSPYHWSGSTPGTNAKSFELSIPYAFDPAVKWIDIWHRVNGGAWLRWLTPVLQNNATDPGYQTWAPSVLVYLPYNAQAQTPPASAPTVRTVQVDGIAVGPATVTARKVYRSAADLTQLRLLTTLADNTTTTHIDAAADSALGATAPSGDTSGLPQPEGQINPGATSIIVASTGPFLSDGGWAIIGNGDQVIRYSGISGGSLVGIPPVGNGAVVATVVYNTTITAAPMLAGIPTSGLRSILRPLTSGDEIYLVVTVENEAAAANLADLLGVPSGWREEWIQDRRLSIAEARARGQATLDLRELEAITVEYSCRDLLTASGKTITINLPPPTNVQATLKIQQVTINNFRPRVAPVDAPMPNAGQYPTFTVSASSARFSFEDLLNRYQVKA